MDKRELTYEEILQIVRLFESSPEVNELHLKFGDTVLDLRKNGAAGAAFWEDPAPQAAVREPANTVAPLDSTPAAATVSPEPFLIKSPTVGTFYCAPEPGAAPFVTVGQRVSPETTVCIIEVMKLMNSIQAECAGVVAQILVKDGEAVEFGQTLIIVEPDRGSSSDEQAADETSRAGASAETTSE